MTASSHLTAARLMLTELESLLREPVNLKEARNVTAALLRHLEEAKAEAASKSVEQLAAEYHTSALDFMTRAIFNPAQR